MRAPGSVGIVESWVCGQSWSLLWKTRAKESSPKPLGVNFEKKTELASTLAALQTAQSTVLLKTHQADFGDPSFLHH